MNDKEVKKMKDSKKSGGPLETEGRALEDVSTIELVNEFRRREDGVTLILDGEKTFHNPIDEPVRIFVVPEFSCNTIRPRFSHRVSRYMKTHRPPWWVLPIINILSLIAILLASLTILLQ